MPRIATFLAVICFVADPAGAEDLCHAPDRSQWIGQEDVARIVEGAGYDSPFVLVVEDGCLEAKLMQAHRKIELYIDPVTGEIVKIKED
jgi:hypothetical protein